jgi:hypothetical protein
VGVFPRRKEEGEDGEEDGLVAYLKLCGKAVHKGSRRCFMGQWYGIHG